MFCPHEQCPVGTQYGPSLNQVGSIGVQDPIVIKEQCAGVVHTSTIKARRLSWLERLKQLRNEDAPIFVKAVISV